MTTFQRKKLRTPLRIRVRRWMRMWPALVWLGAIAVFCVSHNSSETSGSMLGVVEVVAEPIAPLETARLISVEVQVGQEIEAGHVVARFDTAVLDAELVVAEAKMLEAEETIAGYQQDVLQLNRRFEDAIRDAEANLEAERIRQSRDAAQLEELLKEQRRRECLLESKLISEQEVGELRPAIAGLEHSVAAYPALLKIHERRLSDARKGQQELREWLRVGVDGDFTESIRKKMEARSSIFDSSRALRSLEKDTYTLRTSRGGVVSRIFETPGNVVAAGQPVVRVVSQRPKNIIGFLSEERLHATHKGDVFTAVRQGTGKPPCLTTVESIGAEIQTLPGRISPIRNQPMRGRRIVLRIEEPHDMVPGETVRLLPERPKSIFNFL